MGLAHLGEQGNGVVVGSRARGPLPEEKVPLRGTHMPFCKSLVLLPAPHRDPSRGGF